MADRDSEPITLAALGARVRSVEEIFKHFLENTFKTYLEGDAAWKSVMSAKIDTIAKPNLTLLVAVLSLVAIVGLAVLNGVSGKIDANDRRQTEADSRHTHESEKLDERLQREYNLANATIKSEVDALNRISKERHEEAVAQIRANSERLMKMEDWDRERTKSDLEELRQRRMRDGAKP